MDINGIYNLVFLLLVFFCLVAIAYAFGIGDVIIGYIYDLSTKISPESNLTTILHGQYVALRDFTISVIFNFFVPFIILLTFGNTFINANQNVISYMIQALGVLMATPLCIYIFADILTNMLSISIISPAYIASNFFNNFVPILVVNLLLTLASFIWIKKQQV
jgi:hypothetical protein